MEVELEVKLELEVEVEVDCRPGVGLKPQHLKLANRGNVVDPVFHLHLGSFNEMTPPTYILPLPLPLAPLPPSHSLTPCNTSMKPTNRLSDSLDSSLGKLEQAIMIDYELLPGQKKLVLLSCLSITYRYSNNTGKAPKSF